MLNKFCFNILAILFIIILVGCKKNTDVHKDAIRGNQMPELSLTLSLDKAIYNRGESVLALATLSNITNKDLLINSRVAINFPTAPDLLRDIMFNIYKPSGNLSSFIARVNIRPATSNDFIILPAGEKFEIHYNLAKYYNLNEIGNYSVTAIYNNIIDPEGNRIAWKGEVSSNEVLFTITSNTITSTSTYVPPATAMNTQTNTPIILTPTYYPTPRATPTLIPY